MKLETLKEKFTQTFELLNAIIGHQNRLKCCINDATTEIWHLSRCVFDLKGFKAKINLYEVIFELLSCEILKGNRAEMGDSGRFSSRMVTSFRFLATTVRLSFVSSGSGAGEGVVSLIHKLSGHMKCLVTYVKGRPSKR